MPVSDLSAALVRDLLHYDPLTGIFRWRRGCRAGLIAGSRNQKGYWRISIGNKGRQAHRLAWLYMTGCWPLLEVDHIDCDKLNNRFANLRLATSAENKWNTAKQPDTLSIFKGVTLHRTGKWQASIRSHGKQSHLGLFLTEAEAHAAYRSAAQAQHGAFARLS